MDYFITAGIIHDDDIRMIAASLRYLYVPKEQLLYDYGEKSDSFFILLDGLCDFVKPE